MDDVSIEAKKFDQAIGLQSHQTERTPEGVRRICSIHVLETFFLPRNAHFVVDEAHSTGIYIPQDGEEFLS